MPGIPAVRENATVEGFRYRYKPDMNPLTYYVGGCGRVRAKSILFVIHHTKGWYFVLYA